MVVVFKVDIKNKTFNKKELNYNDICYGWLSYAILDNGKLKICKLDDSEYKFVNINDWNYCYLLNNSEIFSDKHIKHIKHIEHIEHIKHIELCGIFSWRGLLKVKIFDEKNNIYKLSYRISDVINVDERECNKKKIKTKFNIVYNNGDVKINGCSEEINNIKKLYFWTLKTLFKKIKCFSDESNIYKFYYEGKEVFSINKEIPIYSESIIYYLIEDLFKIYDKIIKIDDYLNKIDDNNKKI